MYSEANATPTYKSGFGLHPLLVFLDETNEALAGMLRPGRAGANTAADQPLCPAGRGVGPAARRNVSRPTTPRAVSLLVPDSAVRHPRVRGRHRGKGMEFSIGFGLSLAVRRRSFGSPERLGRPMGQDVTSWVPGWPDHRVRGLSARPAGTRAVCRSEQPHPGAQCPSSRPRAGVTRCITNAPTPTSSTSRSVTAARHVEDRIKTPSPGPGLPW